jgi:hypothetical protein
MVIGGLINCGCHAHRESGCTYWWGQLFRRRLLDLHGCVYILPVNDREKQM